jgi:hypothetical protein
MPPFLLELSTGLNLFPECKLIFNLNKIHVAIKKNTLENAEGLIAYEKSITFNISATFFEFSRGF